MAISLCKALALTINQDGRTAENGCRDYETGWRRGNCVQAHINLTRWSQTGVEGDMCSLPNNTPAGITEHEVTEFEWSASVHRSLRLPAVV